MTPAAMLSNPEQGLPYAAATLVRSVAHFGAADALDAAVREFRARGVEPSPAVIATARVAARAAVAEINAELRAKHATPARVGNLAGLRLATFDGVPVQPVNAMQDDVPDLLAIETSLMEAGKLDLAAAVRRERLGMTKPAGSIEPTPFLFCDPATLPRRAWLYGRHFIRGEISLTLAPGGVGKTSLAIAEAAAMVSGRRLLHDDADGPLRVWLWNGEEPEDELARRIGAVSLHFGLTESDFGDRLFIDTGDRLPLVLAEQGRDGVKVLTPVVDRLVAALQARRIDVLMVDPFVSTHSVNENDNSAIQRAASAWKEVAQRANIAIGLAHHVRKLAGRDATAEDSRGGDALVSKVRDARTLNPMNADDAARYGIGPSDRQGYFSTGVGGKSNMSAKGDRKTWFRLVSVGLGNGGGIATPQDHVAVVAPWAPSSVADDVNAETVMRLSAIMAGKVWRAAPQSQNRPDWIGRAVAEAFDVEQDEGFQTRAKHLIRALEKVGVLVRDTAEGPRREPIAVARLGNLSAWESR